MSDDDNNKEDLPELLDQVSPGELEEALERRSTASIVATKRESHFSGPIPPPEVLEYYETINQGFAERIITMAEKEQSHRHEIESVAVNGSVTTEKRGQVFAFILCALVIAGSIGLIAFGQPISGTLLAGSTLVGLAYVFITGRKREEDENEDRT